MLNEKDATSLRGTRRNAPRGINTPGVPLRPMDRASAPSRWRIHSPLRKDTHVAENLQWTETDQRAVDTARILAADAVEKVGSGHPGTAMSLAPVAYLLFQKVMNQDPADDRWEGRDRFILSPGHTSLTLYTQLFLGGYGLEMKDLEELRTWGALTPGHPEYKHTKGVEITTGPLGQGLASAVGFAYAQRRMRGMFDPEAAPGTSPFDHHIYVIASEGDVQEGVTAEASALAGHQELGNLIVVWDRNHISIEEDTDVAFTEDVAKRYESYGWDVQRVDWTRTGEYVEDVAELYAAIERAKAVTDKPSFIELRTIIGYPAPHKQNTGAVHGSKLGAEEVAATKEVLGFDPAKSFFIEENVLEHTRQLRERGAAAHKAWDEKFEAWAKANPERAALYNRLIAGELPADYKAAFPVFEAGTSVATRAASGTVINAIAETFPELWGGSADLAGSNLTTIKGADSFNPVSHSTEDWTGNPYGRVLHFGIREQAAAAIVNGIVLSSPTRAFSGTFFVFSDYQRPAVRLSALMGVPSLYVWTHDSIGVGEDGPTHQPIEHLSARRGARPTSRSSTSPRCVLSPASTWFAPRTLTKPPSHGAPSWRSPTAPQVSCSPVRTCPSGLVKMCTQTPRARSSPPQRAPHAAATSWLTPRAPRTSS